MVDWAKVQLRWMDTEIRKEAASSLATQQRRTTVVFQDRPVRYKANVFVIPKEWDFYGLNSQLQYVKGAQNTAWCRMVKLLKAIEIHGIFNKTTLNSIIQDFVQGKLFPKDTSNFPKSLADFGQGKLWLHSFHEGISQGIDFMKHRLRSTLDKNPVGF